MDKRKQELCELFSKYAPEKNRTLETSYEQNMRRAPYEPLAIDLEMFWDELCSLTIISKFDISDFTGVENTFSIRAFRLFHYDNGRVVPIELSYGTARFENDEIIEGRWDMSTSHEPGQWIERFAAMQHKHAKFEKLPERAIVEDLYDDLVSMDSFLSKNTETTLSPNP